MSSIYSWDINAANNANADDAIDWGEGMAPSNVNDSARFMMARLAEYLGDTGGALAAGGTANAITLATNSSFIAYEDGQIVVFRAQADNTGSVTLNVNNIGAKTIRKMLKSGESTLAAGDIKDDGIFVARYNSALNSANGAWLLLNPVPENIADALFGLATKTAPVDADTVVITDSAADNVGKRVTLANFKTALSSFFALRTRTVTGGGLATGGGDLSANRTITVPIASQGQATGGTANDVAMTPLRTQQAMDANLYTGSNPNNQEYPIKTGLPVVGAGIANSPIGSALNVWVRSDELTFTASSADSNGTQLNGDWRKYGNIASNAVWAVRVG